MHTLHTFLSMLNYVKLYATWEETELHPTYKYYVKLQQWYELSTNIKLDKYLVQSPSYCKQ